MDADDLGEISDGECSVESVDSAMVEESFKNGLTLGKIKYLDEICQIAVHDEALQGQENLIMSAIERVKQYLNTGTGIDRHIEKFVLADFLRFGLSGDVVDRIGYLAFIHGKVYSDVAIQQLSCESFDTCSDSEAENDTKGSKKDAPSFSNLRREDSGTSQFSGISQKSASSLASESSTGSKPRLSRGNSLVLNLTMKYRERTGAGGTSLESPNLRGPEGSGGSDSSGNRTPHSGSTRGASKGGGGTGGGFTSPRTAAAAATATASATGGIGKSVGMSSPSPPPPPPPTPNSVDGSGGLSSMGDSGTGSGSGKSQQGMVRRVMSIDSVDEDDDDDERSEVSSLAGLNIRISSSSRGGRSGGNGTSSTSYSHSYSYSADTRDTLSSSHHQHQQQHRGITPTAVRANLYKANHSKPPAAPPNPNPVPALASALASVSSSSSSSSNATAGGAGATEGAALGLNEASNATSRNSSDLYPQSVSIAVGAIEGPIGTTTTTTTTTTASNGSSTIGSAIGTSSSSSNPTENPVEKRPSYTSINSTCSGTSDSSTSGMGSKVDTSSLNYSSINDHTNMSSGNNSYNYSQQTNTHPVTTTTTINSSSSSSESAVSTPSGVRRGSHKSRTPHWILQRAWRLGENIGNGSFGEVFQGLNDQGKLFAVKRMNVAGRPDAVNDLLSEIQLMRGLSHPNIVQYIGAWVNLEEGQLYIFQEWVPGGSLSDLLKQFGSFALGMVREYTRQILLGLDYLHSNGIIHRDIKGSNILVDAQRTIKLADFGASTRLADFDKTQETTSVKGTPYFMAPEVLASSKYGRKGDVWAVGCTMIQMLNGQPPWKDQNLKGLVQLHMHLSRWNQGVPPIHNRELTPDAQECLEMCFQKNEADRPMVKELLQCIFFTRPIREESEDSFSSSSSVSFRSGSSRGESADALDDSLKQQITRASRKAPSLQAQQPPPQLQQQSQSQKDQQQQDQLPPRHASQSSSRSHDTVEDIQGQLNAMQLDGCSGSFSFQKTKPLVEQEDISPKKPPTLPTGRPNHNQLHTSSDLVAAGLVASVGSNSGGGAHLKHVPSPTKAKPLSAHKGNPFAMGFKKSPNVTKLRARPKEDDDEVEAGKDSDMLGRSFDGHNNNEEKEGEIDSPSTAAAVVNGQPASPAEPHNGSSRSSNTKSNSSSNNSRTSGSSGIKVDVDNFRHVGGVVLPGPAISSPAGPAAGVRLQTRSHSTEVSELTLDSFSRSYSQGVFFGETSLGSIPEVGIGGARVDGATSEDDEDDELGNDNDGPTQELTPSRSRTSRTSTASGSGSGTSAGSGSNSSSSLTAESAVKKEAKRLLACDSVLGMEDGSNIPSINIENNTKVSDNNGNSDDNENEQTVTTPRMRTLARLSILKRRHLGAIEPYRGTYFCGQVGRIVNNLDQVCSDRPFYQCKDCYKFQRQQYPICKQGHPYKLDAGNTRLKNIFKKKEPPCTLCSQTVEGLKHWRCKICSETICFDCHPAANTGDGPPSELFPTGTK